MKLAPYLNPGVGGQAYLRLRIKQDAKRSRVRRTALHQKAAYCIGIPARPLLAVQKSGYADLLAFKLLLIQINRAECLRENLWIHVDYRLVIQLTGQFCELSLIRINGGKAFFSPGFR
ncbi:hypothetical protein D3C81_1652310 [compost metagenome]